jgi:hypothetical protein
MTRHWFRAGFRNNKEFGFAQACCDIWHSQGFAPILKILSFRSALKARESLPKGT